MKKIWRKTIAVLLLLSLALAGCGKKEPAVAVLDGEKIPLAEAVFYTRMNQQQWEAAYVDTFGRDFWTRPLGDGGGTFADELKRQVMDMVCEIHVMNAHAKEYGVELTKDEKKDIESRTADFLAGQDEQLRKEAGAEKELVEELMTQRMLADKVAEAAVADYEPEVTQEEAALGKLVYCLFSTLGTHEAGEEQTGVTAQEEADIRAEATAFASRAAELQDLTAAAQEAGHTCIDVYFNEEIDGGAHELVASTARTLTVGQVAGPLKTEEGYYVIQYVSELDEEATQNNREQIAARKKEARCREIYEKWLSEMEFTVDQEAWDSVKVDQLLFSE